MVLECVLTPLLLNALMVVIPLWNIELVTQVLSDPAKTDTRHLM